jgi:hypothetical protein
MSRADEREGDGDVCCVIETTGGMKESETLSVERVKMVYVN